jgi:hypothetical protein
MLINANVSAHQIVLNYRSNHMKTWTIVIFLALLSEHGRVSIGRHGWKLLLAIRSLVGNDSGGLLISSCSRLLTGNEQAKPRLTKRK